jgi:large subunit ribosomal protein LP0
MGVVKKSEKQAKKDQRWRRVQEAAFKYKNVLFIDANCVSSKQICQIRSKLRPIDACMVMGKNTLMRAALTAAKAKPVVGDDDYELRRDEWYENPNLDRIITQLRNNTNLIFSNGDLGEVKAVLDSVVRPSPAKPGMIAPGPVSIPAGATGLDPKQTSFFQTLQIQTKIVKAQIDIITEKQVIWKGDKIGATEAQLLDKLKIYPFEYKMEVKKVLQNGSLFDAAVLDLSTEVILGKFKAACKTQASLSLGLGVPTSASAPHSLLNGFKNLLCVSLASDFKFKQADAFVKAAMAGPAVAAGPATAAKAEVVEEKEEAGVDMGGAADLFGGGDDEYY